MKKLRALWKRIHEPRVIAVTYFVMYLVLLGGGAYALINPPNSIEGMIGTLAMYALAVLLTLGAGLGALAVLPGSWWLERTAVVAIGASAALYGFIIVGLQIGSTAGSNRMLQLAFVIFVLGAQVIRWHRVTQRPYDPSRVVATP